MWGALSCPSCSAGEGPDPLGSLGSMRPSCLMAKMAVPPCGLASRSRGGRRPDGRKAQAMTKGAGVIYGLLGPQLVLLDEEQVRELLGRCGLQPCPA